MSSERFETIWARICHFQGNKFTTKTGRPFSYSVESGALWVERDGHRINQSLAKSNFSQVYAMMRGGPINGPREINKRAIKDGQSQVRGCSYVWAILHDKRILP